MIEGCGFKIKLEDVESIVSQLNNDSPKEWNAVDLGRAGIVHFDKKGTDIFLEELQKVCE